MGGVRWVGIGIVTRFECDGGGWGRVGGEGGWREKGCRCIGRVVIYLFILKYFAYVLYNYNVCLEICVQYNCCKLNVWDLALLRFNAYAKSQINYLIENKLN